MRLLTLLTCGAALLLRGGGVAVQESVAFTYDVHGRLIQVSRGNASGPDSTSAYTYDPADNRTSRTITVTSARSAREGPVDPALLLVDPTATPPIALRAPGTTAPRQPTLTSKTSEGADR